MLINAVVMPALADKATRDRSDPRPPRAADEQPDAEGRDRQAHVLLDEEQRGKEERAAAPALALGGVDRPRDDRRRKGRLVEVEVDGRPDAPEQGVGHGDRQRLCLSEPPARDAVDTDDRDADQKGLADERRCGP